LPPLLFAGAKLSKRGQAGDDEKNMGDASDEHHERVGSVRMAGTKKSPKLMRSGLYEVGAEPLEAVPSHGDRDAGAMLVSAGPVPINLAIWLFLSSDSYRVGPG
jgi:hypothetical protein